MIHTSWNFQHLKLEPLSLKNQLICQGWILKNKKKIVINVKFKIYWCKKLVVQDRVLLWRKILSKTTSVKNKNISYNTDELYFYPKKVFLKYLTQNQVCMQLLGWYLHLSWPYCQLPAGLAWSWKLDRYDLFWPCCQLPAGLAWSWKLYRYDLSWPCCQLPAGLIWSWKLFRYVAFIFSWFVLIFRFNREEGDIGR